MSFFKVPLCEIDNSYDFPGTAPLMMIFSMLSRILSPVSAIFSGAAGSNMKGRNFPAPSEILTSRSLTNLGLRLFKFSVVIGYTVDSGSVHESVATKSPFPDATNERLSMAVLAKVPSEIKFDEPTFKMTFAAFSMSKRPQPVL